jgi:anti-anti-sigma factor
MVSFDEPIGKLLGGGCYAERLLLDLHLVETIDSSGVSWLLVCQRKFRTAGGMLVLHSLSPFVQDVVKVLNMRLVFTIADSEQAALALVRGVRAAG